MVGTALAPPGTYPVHLEVADGVTTKAFDRNVVVTAESATAAYDGPTYRVRDAAAVRTPSTSRCPRPSPRCSDGTPGLLTPPP